MFSYNYLGSFSRQLEPRYNPATVRIPFLRGVMASLPYGQEPIPRPQAVRVIQGREKVTRLGSLSVSKQGSRRKV